MERITFCPSCGEANPIRSVRCETCDAPLRKVRDWKGLAKRIPRPTPLALLIAAAVVALIVAVVTGLVSRP